MEIRSIMCCCGQGLGSSMIVSMNVEKALKKLGVSGVKVEHTAIGEVTEGSADLFVIGADLAPQMTSYKNKIILNQLMDMNEIERSIRSLKKRKKKAVSSILLFLYKFLIKNSRNKRENWSIANCTANVKRAVPYIA